MKKKTKPAGTEKHPPSPVQPAQDEAPKTETPPFLQPFSIGGRDYEVPPPLGVAERWAKWEDELAGRYEAKRLSDLAGEHRDKAAWWRNLADSAKEKTWFKARRDALCAIDTLLALAESKNHGGGASVHILAFIADHLLYGLHALAANGNDDAVREWGRVLCEGSSGFITLALHKPELIRDWARVNPTIPGVISQSLTVTKSNADLVKRLRVGEWYPLAIVPKGKRGRHWKLKKPANRLAADLQEYIAGWRHFPEIRNFEAEQDGQRLPEWAADAAKLERWSRTTWDEWAKIAWRVLVQISSDGHPGQHPALLAIFNPKTTQTNAYGKKESSPGIADNDIKGKVFDAFEQIATGVSRRTRERTVKKKKRAAKARKPA